MKTLALTLALTVAALATTASAGSARSAGSTPPVLTVTSNADGSLHATWTMPAGEVGMEFLYDSSAGSGGKLEQIGHLGTNEDGYTVCLPSDREHWCYPERGDPLYCYDVLYHYGDGDCPGHQDIGDTQTSLDTEPLTNGATYWVQVVTWDTCNGSPTNCPYPQEWWSNLVQVTAKVTPSSGGGSKGSGGSGASTTAKATFSTLVSVTHNGRTAKTRSATLRAGDLVTTAGAPATISSNWGTLTLDRNSTLGWLTPGALSAWTAERGTVYYAWGNGGKGVAVQGYHAQFSSSDDEATPGAATIAPSKSGGDAVTCVRGHVLVWPIGNGAGNVTIEAGQQVTVKGKTVSAPRRFVPTRVFWKH
ncbi:MAG TPA: hypothetical protein VHD91_00785 [Gaiellaceae bacterium]|nr:hypothetical protein [Gaiellaceae bacterium]